MDELEQFLGGGQAIAEPANRPVNNPGNMRPVGASTGFQQYKTPEEGIAAADQNLKVYGEKHGINTLRGVISRWAPPQDKNDTESYINTVAQKIGLDPNQKINLSDPVQRHVISGAMFTVEKGAKNLFKSAPEEQTAQASGDPLEAFLSGETGQPTKSVQSQPKATQPTVNQPTTNQSVENKPTIANTASQSMADMINSFQQKKQALGEKVAGAIDSLYGATVPAAYGAVTQAIARTANTPQRAEEIGQAAASSISQPLGKALGLTGKQNYEHPLGSFGERAADVVNHMFNVLHLTPEQISEKTGIPPEDLRNMGVVGSFAIPTALKETGAGVAKVVQPIRQATKELEFVKPGEVKKVTEEKAPAGSVGAAKVENNPLAGKITGEEGARGVYPQIKLSKITSDVPKEEQAIRSQAVQEVMPNAQVRPGVITGNENTLRNEYTKAKMDTPEGQLFKQQIANEQVALSDYAQKRIDNTGASPTLVTPYERGQRINDAFSGDEGLSGFFKSEKKQLYKEASDKTGNNPIQSSNVENLLKNEQFRAGLGLKKNEGVGTSAEKLINLAKTVGFEDEVGNFHEPNTVGAWTAVQKSLNNNWTVDNASTIRKINQAIERDIGAAGGLELLKKADSLHQAEKVLFGSKGIKQLFGDIDPNGVQTATAFDAIPQKLNSMPLDQWKHIYDTAEKISNGKITGPLDAKTGEPKWQIEVPNELRISAHSAMNEMKGSIAREIYQAGAAKAGEWNQNAVNKILNARADKIKAVFSPEEQKAFHYLNVVGHLTPGVHGYEGAGLQARRIGLIESHLGKIGTATGATIGGAIGGPGGAAVGGYLGGKAAEKGVASMETKALQKAAEKSQEEMKKATEIGKNKLSDISKGKQ